MFYYLPSSTTGQSECTEDEAMLESRGSGDVTSSSTSNPEQQPELDHEPNQQPEFNPEPNQQRELDPEPEQHPELVPEPEQHPEWEADQNLVNSSVFIFHQKCLYIIHWDSQPSVESILVQTLYLDGLIHVSSHPGCYLCVSTIHHPVMARWCIPLYADDVHLMHPDLFTLLDFINGVVKRFMIVSTMEFPVFWVAVSFKQAK